MRHRASPAAAPVAGVALGTPVFAAQVQREVEVAAPRDEVWLYEAGLQSLKGAFE